MSTLPAHCADPGTARLAQVFGVFPADTYKRESYAKSRASSASRPEMLAPPSLFVASCSVP